MLLPLDASGVHPQSRPPVETPEELGARLAREARSAAAGVLPRATAPAVVDARLSDLVEGIRLELRRAGDTLDRLEALIRSRRP